ncbi:MAG: hypothetical protein LBB56_05170 [Chitinispirillales bacterium]|nr:hypothetical protein [Chitinispirillales bacterium]
MAEYFVGTGQQFDNILNAINSCANGDIITITDSRTYTEAFNDVSRNGITIRSSVNAPDDFPALKIYFNSNTLNHIDNWTFKSVIMEPNGDSRFTFNLKNITFTQCVFRNYDYLCSCDWQAQSVKKFESCLFYNFSGFVFDAQKNFDNNALLISNCTFHNCADIFKNDFWNEAAASYPKISNCVFTNCSGIASQVTDGAQQPNRRRHMILQQFKYCTFSNNPQTPTAALGENCFINENEAGIYAAAGRTLPSHFKIKDNPKVYNSGSNALGSSPALDGSARVPPYDRGAWEYAGQEPPIVNKTILPYIYYQGAF